jgi:hypothetical protein
VRPLGSYGRIPNVCFTIEMMKFPPPTWAGPEWGEYCCDGQGGGSPLLKGRQPECRPWTANLGHRNGDRSMLGFASAPARGVA